MKLKIGDRVQIVEGTDPTDYFDGIGIYKGQSAVDDGSIAIQREDGVPGGAQRNWWNFSKENLRFLVKVGKTGGPKVEKGDFARWYAEYIKIRSVNYKAEIQKIEAQIEDLNNRISDFKISYKRLLRNKRKKRADENFDAFKKNILKSIEKFEAQLKAKQNEITILVQRQKEERAGTPAKKVLRKLKKHARVEKIYVDNATNQLVVETDTISILNINIGRFTVRLPLRRTTTDLRIKNKNGYVTYDGSQYYHPHIWAPQGGLCEGGYKDPLTRADRSANLFLFIDAVIAFLESCTEGHYRHILAKWAPKGVKVPTYDKGRRKEDGEEEEEDEDEEDEEW